MKLNDFRDFTRVAIIDDVEKEGVAIQGILIDQDIASVFYKIDDLSRNATCLPATPLNNVTLVFLDLEYEGARGGDAGHANVAIRSLQKIVGEKSNYILIVWSSHTTDRIKEEFQKGLDRQNDFGKPFVDPQYMSKSEFLDDGDIKKVSETLSTLLSGLPASSVFLESERISVNAASSSVNSLVSNRDEIELVKVINSLSASYGSIDDTGPQKNRNALMVISSLFFDSIENKLLEHDFSNIDIDSKDLLSSEEKARLNQLLIFSNETSSGGSGSVYLNKSTSDSVKSKYLVKNKEFFEDKEKGFYDKHIIPVFIDLTPVCDSAQGKGVIYCVSGLLYPVCLDDGTTKVKMNSSSPETVLYYLHKEFFYNKKIYNLVIDKRTYHSMHGMKFIGDPILKLRQGILMDFQKEIASHISRPGHVLL